MDGDYFLIPPDTGKAPRNPHPWSLIPFIKDEEQIITHVDRGDRYHQVVKGEDIKRVSKWHGHVFQTYYSPDMGMLFSRTFGARSINFGYTHETGLTHLHPDVDDKDKIREGNMTRTVGWEMWKRVKGEVCDQEYRYSDTMFIHVLRHPWQFRNAIEFVQERAEKPSKYQVVGWAADNCVDFAAKTLDAAKVERPLLWTPCPWPWAVDLYIQRVAQQEARGKRPRVRGTKYVRAVTGKNVRQSFEARRSGGAAQRQLAHLGAA